MKNPCKLCLVLPACTTKCEDRKTYKRWKRNLKRKIKDTIIDITALCVISIFVVFSFLAMIANGAR